MERRCGIPITLSLVHMEVGSAAGIDMQGVNLPAHLLLRFGCGPSFGLLDAFSNRVIPQNLTKNVIEFFGGQPPPLSKPLFLMRMLMNLHGVYMRTNDEVHAKRLGPYLRLLS